MAKAKEYTIIQTRYRYGYGDPHVKENTGTLDYLKEYFSYTLECGRSWQWEKGRKKIPEMQNIRSGKVLVNALNNAEDNRAANGCGNTSYQLKEVA